MRIACAKCGHPHDSTVTPFMHDIVEGANSFDKEVIPSFNLGLPDLTACGKYKMSDFKCEKCGNVNTIMLVWSVMERKNREYTPIKEKEWAKANKYEKAITNSGKVHYVTTGCWQDGKVEPFCNSRSWLSDYWGKKWELTDKPVTCKNCLSKMRRMMKEESANAPEGTD